MKGRTIEPFAYPVDTDTDDCVLPGRGVPFEIYPKRQRHDVVGEIARGQHFTEGEIRRLAAATIYLDSIDEYPGEAALIRGIDAEVESLKASGVGYIKLLTIIGRGWEEGE